MAEDINKRLVKSYHEATNQKDIRAFDQLFASDFINEAMGFAPIRGIQPMKQLLEKLLIAFPDWRVEIRDVISEGDRVAVRWHLTATHLGTYEDISPTNQPIEGHGIHIDQIKNEQIIKRWASNKFFEIFHRLRQHR